MRWMALLTLLCLTACTPKDKQVFPEPENLPAIQVSLSNNQPQVGEPVDLHIQITSDERLVLPPPADWLDPAIEILDSSSKESLEESPWRQQYNLQVALFQVTNLSVFAETTIATLSEPAINLDIPFETLDIQSVLTEEDDVPMFGNDELPDFRGSEALRRQRRNLIIALAVTFCVIIIVACLIWYFINKPKKQPPPIPADLIAFKKMDELTQSEIWQQSNADACAVALSSILRIYIEGRFAIHAPEQTTEEFLELAEEKSPWSASEQAGLNDFFRVTDQIKYAAARPEHDVLENLLNVSRTFVETTRQTSQEVTP